MVFLFRMLAKLLSLLLLAVLVAPRANAQSGCPDPQASNYNPAATTNDGSCTYPVTTTALLTKATLPSAVNESSGLLYTGGSVWTHNDSGNPAAAQPSVPSGYQVALRKPYERARLVAFQLIQQSDRQ